MKDCKTCVHFRDDGALLRCVRLGTLCDVIPDPDLGRKLPGCAYAPKNKPEKKKTEDVKESAEHGEL